MSAENEQKDDLHIVERGREFLRIVPTPTSFDIVIPQGIEPTDAAREFIRIVTGMLPPREGPALGEWIDVRVARPPLRTLIVAYGPEIYCVICQLMQDEDGISFVGPYMSVHPDLVTHWYLLPEPPQEEK